MVSPSTWILSLKLLFISTGVISLATFMHYSVPLILQGFPTVWSTVTSWMKPPYLYVIINGIIIIIAAFSRFSSHKVYEHDDEEVKVQSEPLVSSSKALETGVGSDYGVEGLQVVLYEESEEKVLKVIGEEDDGEDLMGLSRSIWSVPQRKVSMEDERQSEEKVLKVVGDDDDEQGDDLMGLPRSMWSTPQRNVSMEIERQSGLMPVSEKPPVSSRFGNRKPVKATPEGGRALKVAKPKRQETLESTWKTITEGRHMPLTRHLKKSDTWEHHSREIQVTSVDHYSPDKVMKSETFKDRTIYDSKMSTSPAPSSGKIRKEPSLSQEELNRRVEGFIKKVNEEMRLQRQESLNHYMEMINRGAH